MLENVDWAVVIPLANEEESFDSFARELTGILNTTRSGQVYLVVDKASKDSTLDLCKKLSYKDSRFTTVWEPRNTNVVDAYLRGYDEAFKNGHQFIVEMDGGFSHDPKALPLLLEPLVEGYECVFGSRFIDGGSMEESGRYRLFLSKGGTLVANALLGTRMKDMTSGFQGFHRSIVQQFLDYKFISKGHFYQTELRFLLRKKRYVEVPIHYRATSGTVSGYSVFNSLYCLLYYCLNRNTGI